MGQVKSQLYEPYMEAHEVFEPIVPIKVERITDEELAGQSLMEAMDRLGALLEKHKQLTGSK